MDNLAHALAGAALGQAGLKTRTRFGMAALIVAANLPDVDALGLFFGENLAWRRGWTHGPVAMLVLPPLLVAALVFLDKWQRRRRTPPPGQPAVNIGWLFALVYIGWASHPLLDFMNTYGIRLLMPFSERWFYGDVLFIIDPWLWIALALGVWLAARRWRRGMAHPGRPAWVALGLLCCYAMAMGASSVAAERLTRQAAEARGHGPIRAAVASPVPIDPFRREVVFATDSAYGFGELRWTPFPELRLDPGLIPTNMDDPAIRQARQTKEIADFLYWSRLPFATVDRRSDSTIVTIADARYARGPGSGTFVRKVRLPPASLPHQPERTPQRPQPDQEHDGKRRQIE
ncbi:metal-dependent hydrolase [Sphingosinicella rhizophila]|uniref:Metal-dependent hydrolase n=1 Tax=Sphingosinicella rhizophila TaxID=3050082 RepID=A0ABU3Q6U6_9SPHN|nr:metal-dependent hydrolase [Sphingosinicella sp. GR2756]MDT9599121.1 metal-dependent hydrolase [Sphingosinicella sp. GR2756]